MRILMLADVFFPDTVGGAGRVVYHLASELSARGHQIHVITRNNDPKRPLHEQLSPGLQVHRFLSPSSESFGLFLTEIKSSYRLAKGLAKEASFDLICTHQTLPAMGPLLSPRLRKLPLIHYFHSPWHEEFLVKKQEGRLRPGKRNRLIALMMKRMEKRLLFRAARVIVLSDYMRNRTLNLHSFPGERVRKIPGGVDLDHYTLPPGGKAMAKEAVNVPSHKTVFLSVRNLVPRMGIETLIQGFSQSKVLREKALLLIGGTGFLEDRLKRQVETSRLQESVRFLGHVPDEDLPQIYQASDFFVLPTRELEGFGLVILEAMACGTPVLGTPVGAIPELIGTFDKRLLFEGTEWQNMKARLEEIVQSPERFRIDPQACRAFVEENFSWKKTADAFEREARNCLRQVR